MDNQKTMIKEWVEKSLEKYPPNMQSKHVAEFLGVGKVTVYKLLRDGKIPTLTIPGYKFLFIPKVTFTDWYVQSLECNDAELVCNDAD